MADIVEKTQKQGLAARLRAGSRDTSVRHALATFASLRLLLSGWALVVLAAIPLPAAPDEVLRPYLGQPILRDGLAGLLLGPWQRFDALHYTRIAAAGYAFPADSVFPPLYPLLVRALGWLLGGGHAAALAAAIVLSNAALVGLLILLHRVVTAEQDAAVASRTLIYFALFPTGFFLFAPYSESLFLLLALASLWAGRNGRFALAGVCGFLAALTRLTGWILVVPLLYEWWRQRPARATTVSGRVGPLAAVGLPPLALVGFMGYRWLAGLPSLGAVYAAHWYQRTGLPGLDLWRALQTMFGGGEARAGEFTLWFDFACALLLLATTILAFRRLGITWGLYAGLLLAFMLLPTSDLKPLYSFSRYALAFFPTFILLARAGKRPWLNRVILYGSLVLYLYFSGQFFIWGWVA